MSGNQNQIVKRPACSPRPTCPPKTPPTNRRPYCWSESKQLSSTRTEHGMAYSNIAESLLEMHYFRVLVRRYRRVLGRDVQVFKPATNAEHWYGFDQAFFTADIPKPELVKDLRQFIQSSTAPRFTSFRAFLLQFKVVEVARRRSARSPHGWNAPYCRSDLYLEPNRKTGISQHEALRRLSGLAGASVAYVCPMIFEENDVLKRPRFKDRPARKTIQPAA